MSCDETDPKRSPIALEIQSLKDSAIAAQDKRGALPQPLFWSLFSHKLKSIRAKKEVEATVREFLDG